VRSPYLG
jgi:hypothetical protein